ncbi:hypothetical protein MNBD_BACTEROID01-2939 [hydrothermal vent metagenome]|uniref:Uncharacterized protein n=1 Tax=hydrothermal vent metagenome TaxID=652676 RepID=A0A3B0U5H4_9ZZZZ
MHRAAAKSISIAFSEGFTLSEALTITVLPDSTFLILDFFFFLFLKGIIHKLFYCEAKLL